MRRGITYSLLFSVVLVFNACKKEPLPILPDSNDPVYTLNGKINDENFSIQVGVGDATISYGVDQLNGIETFYGLVESPSKDFALRVDILRPELFPAGSGTNGLIGDDPDFFVHSPGCLMLGFGNSSAQLDNMLIKNDEGKFEIGNTVQFEEFGLDTLTLKFTDFEAKTFKIPVTYGFEQLQLNPGFTSSGTGDTCVLTSLSTYPYHEWYVNDDLVSEDASFEIHLQDGIHMIKHIVMDGAGNAASYTSLVRFRNDEYQWQLQYNYCTQVVQSNYGKMMVSFRKDNVWYRSNKVLTNGAQKFDLENLNYISDEEGMPKMAYFDIKFNALLRDNSQSLSLTLQNIGGKIAVGLK